MLFGVRRRVRARVGLSFGAGGGRGRSLALLKAAGFRGGVGISGWFGERGFIRGRALRRGLGRVIGRIARLEILTFYWPLRKIGRHSIAFLRRYQLNCYRCKILHFLNCYI